MLIFCTIFVLAYQQVVQADGGTFCKEEFDVNNTKTCGESTNTNCTYFQNNAYPSTYDSVGSCQLTVNKCASGVCQLRAQSCTSYQRLLAILPKSLVREFGNPNWGIHSILSFPYQTTC